MSNYMNRLKDKVFIPGNEWELLQNYDDENIGKRNDRPLKVLRESEFKLAEDAPQWIRSIQDNIYYNRTTINIKGGGRKDVILYNAEYRGMAYTFKLEKEPFSWEKYSNKNGEMGFRKVKTKYDDPEKQEEAMLRYENDLQKLVSKFGTLHEKVQKRLNFPQADRIYGQFFKHKGDKYRIVVTSIPKCKEDVWSFFLDKVAKTKDSEDGYTAFQLKQIVWSTLVYETVKVLKILHENNVFLLDIKPSNIFVCNGPKNKGFLNKGKLFQFGDVDEADICENQSSGLGLCKSQIRTPDFVPVRWRHLANIIGYTIRDVHALTTSLLWLCLLIFPVSLQDGTESVLVMKVLDDSKEALGPESGNPNSSEYMDEEEWEQRYKKTKTTFSRMFNEQSGAYPDNIKEMMTLVEVLLQTHRNTALAGRHILVKNKYKLPSLDKVIQPKELRQWMILIKSKAKECGAATFTRANTVVGRFNSSVFRETDNTHDLKF